MVKSKRQMFIVIGVFTLVMLLGTVAYAFFNYTRTGAANNIRTGRIYFNTTQGEALNLTNIFPMTSTEAASANLNSVTVGIVGDTNYTDGEEFEITLTGVNNTINGKVIPINYIATYTAATGATIGEASNTYFEARNNKDGNIYKLNATGKVEDGKEVLVGYIKSGDTGISGTLTIKAYIDADRIAISDTYPEGVHYGLNSNMTSIEITSCETILATGYTGSETAALFCAGTGTRGGKTFQEHLDEGIFTVSEINDLVEANVILEEYTNGTTTTWVRGRTVLTTSEWNSLKNTGNPISFKIKAESNEGIWVGKLGTCPGCKFIYTTEKMYAIWNTSSQTPTVLTTGLSDSYSEVIANSGKNYFLGVKLNNSNQITNAYACGIKNNVPFCVEATLDGQNLNEKKAFLQSAELWNNSCDDEGEGEDMYCDSDVSINSDIFVNVYDYGGVDVGKDNNYCYAGDDDIFCK